MRTRGSRAQVAGWHSQALPPDSLILIEGEEPWAASPGAKKSNSVHGESSRYESARRYHDWGIKRNGANTTGPSVLAESRILPRPRILIVRDAKPTSSDCATIAPRTSPWQCPLEGRLRAPRIAHPATRAVTAAMSDRLDVYTAHFLYGSS